MAASRWMFTKEQLQNTPSRKCGIDADKELSYRQQAANLIQDMGQRLSVTQLCINTAIVYMHRFYMFQSFTRFPRNEMAPACLFLAAKVEEQPRKLEHVIKVAHSCLHRDKTPSLDTKTEAYLEQAQLLVMNENYLLQTLGFEVTVDHPHTHVVKATQLVKASKDLSQTSYFLATNSLHLTALCLQYRPTIVACVCIYLACKWSDWKIPRSNEGKEWYQYVDRTVTPELLEELYNEFLTILDKCPHKLRKKIMGWKGGAAEGPGQNEYQASVDQLRKATQAENAMNDSGHQKPSVSSQDAHPSTSTTSHRHTNHERKDPSHPEPNKDSHGDPKHGHDHSRVDHRKEWHHERKDGHSDKRVLPPDRREAHAERKDSHVDGPDRKMARREGHPERRDGHHGEKKDALVSGHSLDSQSGRDMASRLHGPGSKDRVDGKSAHRQRIDMHNPNVKKEHENRSQAATMMAAPPAQVNSSKGDNSVSELKIKMEPGAVPGNNPTSTTSQSSLTGQATELRRVKSETAINYKDYLKRKELEKQERERLLKRKLEEEIAKAKQQKEAKESMLELKHRPPRLNISASATSAASHERKHSNNPAKNERPFEVNIKSPTKPHCITVKSPIKSSDLKQIKLEISKVQITPEKDGSDPFSVNINTDPQIKKMLEPKNQESAASCSTVNGVESANGVKRERMESVHVDGVGVHTKVEVKNSDRVKTEPLESTSVETSVRTDCNTPPVYKIKESDTNCLEGSSTGSPAPLKLSIRTDTGSGRSTPVISQSKSDRGSGASTPIKLKLSVPTPAAGDSPLKFKISTKGLNSEGENSSSKHSSPHRRHKHKDKHKKHSRDHEKRREKHREHKSSGSSGGSSSSSAVVGGTNGQSLKMSIKLSDIQGHSSSSNDSTKQKLRHKMTNNDEAERHQPWTVSEIVTKPPGTSSSRKRPRTPVSDQNHDALKSAKLESHRIRRSSSSHSVVSMEMSDGDDGAAADESADARNAVAVPMNQLQDKLQQMITLTRHKVQALQNKQKRQPPQQQHRAKNRYERQQSGFDIEGMMWQSGSPSTEQPPLPLDNPPPLPMTPPLSQGAPPPPPSRFSQGAPPPPPPPPK